MVMPRFRWDRRRLPYTPEIIVENRLYANGILVGAATLRANNGGASRAYWTISVNGVGRMGKREGWPPDREGMAKSALERDIERRWKI